MFDSTTSAIDAELKETECKRQTLATLSLLVKFLDHASILNDIFATYSPHGTVEYQPTSEHSRANARCKIGFERTGTGECVEVEVSVFRDADSCSVLCNLGNSTLLHYECVDHAPTLSERREIAAMLYGALKVFTY